MSRKIILVATDRDFHYAMDGKLVGILEPNDGTCHLDAEGIPLIRLSILSLSLSFSVNVCVCCVCVCVCVRERERERERRHCI